MAESPGVLSGYSVVYNEQASVATPAGTFREMIARGALSGALASNKVREVPLLRDHSPGRLLARVGSGTLRLNDTPEGLRFEADMPSTEAAKETIELVSRGDLRGCSFAFVVSHDDWIDDGGPGPLRIVQGISTLFDTSICTMPAYRGTSVWLKGSRSGGLRELNIKWAAMTALEAEGRMVPAPAWFTRLPSWVTARGRHGCRHALGYQSTRLNGVN